MKHIFALAFIVSVPLTAFAQAQMQPRHSTARAAISPLPPPTSRPSATPSPSPTPTASPAPGVTPIPSPVPSVTPTPLPSPLPTPLVLPPDAMPQILAVTVSQPVFHSGDTIASTVITSTNVAAVELRLAGRTIRYPRLDFGIWQLSYKIPHIPRRFLRDYAAELAAMNTAGVTAVRPVTISFR